MFKSFIVGAATVVAVGLAAVGTVPQAWAAPQPPGAGASCANADLDTCYTKDQMEEFLEVIDELVLGYLKEIGVAEEDLPEVVYVPEGETVPIDCHDPEGNRQSETDKAYSYCGGDNTIYIGQNQLWNFYQKYGAAGPIAGLAHEYGHFLQNLQGVPGSQTPEESVVYENQADCISGAFFSYLDDQGNVEYAEDLENLAGISVEIASAEGPDRDHGTVEERRASFGLGFFGDLPACNSFYPDAPIAS